MNAVAISNLDYAPSIGGAEKAVTQSAYDMKEAGMLAPQTDLAALAAKAFVHLDGVTDEWLNGLQVEKLADGQLPPGEDIRQYAQLLLAPGQKNCCIGRK